jgi:hypothetical protein
MLSLDQILDNAEPSKVAGKSYVGEHFSGLVDIHANCSDISCQSER